MCQFLIVLAAAEAAIPTEVLDTLLEPLMAPLQEVTAEAVVASTPAAVAEVTAMHPGVPAAELVTAPAAMAVPLVAVVKLPEVEVEVAPVTVAVVAQALASAVAVAVHQAVQALAWLVAQEVGAPATVLTAPAEVLPFWLMEATEATVTPVAVAVVVVPTMVVVHHGRLHQARIYSPT